MRTLRNQKIFFTGALLAVFALPVSADIVINEILPNPSGDDVGTERLEIYNTGPSAVDVTGWAIDDAATIDETAVRARIPEDFDTSVCPASAIIQPGEYRVVKGQSTSPYLNNGGDDVYLISDRTLNPNVVDVVTYPSASSQVNNVWAAVPDGSTNFAWNAQSLCASNGGAGDTTPPSTVTDLLAGP
ncbi:MAG: lamin tail domain-containing protein, partial [Gemmatimonadetes bacterium]|nr:lamin tail domain-containing protein [Gemmatimonadota bacterium]